MMFDPIQVVIDTYVEELGNNYIDTYGKRFPEFPKLIGFIGRLALENIANSDAPYHDTNHTIMVTDVGQAILKGKHISEGGYRRKPGYISSRRFCAMISAMCVAFVEATPTEITSSMRLAIL